MIVLSDISLGQVLPFYIRCDAAGAVCGVGATLAKLTGRMDLIGARLSEVVKVQRPQVQEMPHGLGALVGRRLHVVLETRLGREKMRAVAAPDAEGGYLLVLSKGHGLSELVGRYDLTMQDFSPCDPVLEMFFLAEANRAAIAESARLNVRLDQARITATREASVDVLTGLSNRRAFERALHEICEQGTDFALMHLDLDHFKAVNDRFGHAAGDYVLKQAAGILTQEVRQNDMVGRMGGDEFMVLLIDDLSQRQIEHIARRIMDLLCMPFDYEGASLRVSVSVGTTLSEHYDRPDPVVMMRDADDALYKSKAAGRAAHTFYEPPVRGSDGEVMA